MADAWVVLGGSIAIDLVLIAAISILVGCLVYKSKKFNTKRSLVPSEVKDYLEKKIPEGEFSKNGFYWQLDVQDPELKSGMSEMDLVLARKSDASESLELSNFDIIFRYDEEDIGE